MWPIGYANSLGSDTITLIFGYLASPVWHHNLTTPGERAYC